jgi:hypothetical protein
VPYHHSWDQVGRRLPEWGPSTDRDLDEHVRHLLGSPTGREAVAQALGSATVAVLLEIKSLLETVRAELAAVRFNTTAPQAPPPAPPPTPVADAMPLALTPQPLPPNPRPLLATADRTGLTPWVADLVGRMVRHNLFTYLDELTADGLLAVPGVGPRTARAILAWCDAALGGTRVRLADLKPERLRLGVRGANAVRALVQAGEPVYLDQLNEVHLLGVPGCGITTTQEILRWRDQTIAAPNGAKPPG